MADVLIRAWGDWHRCDASVRGSVPVGVPCVLPTGEWAAGGRLGAEHHQAGALAAADFALGNTDGYARIGTVIAPTRWYGRRETLPCPLTQSVGSGRAA